MPSLNKLAPMQVKGAAKQYTMVRRLHEKKDTALYINFTFKIQAAFTDSEF